MENSAVLHEIGTIQRDFGQRTDHGKLLHEYFRRRMVIGHDDALVRRLEKTLRELKGYPLTFGDAIYYSITTGSVEGRIRDGEAECEHCALLKACVCFAFVEAQQ